MKYVKYCSFLVLLLVVWLFINELYILHVDDFSTEFPYMTFYRPNKLNYITEEKMVTDIENTANKYNVKIFVVQNQIKSNNAKSVVIYSTSDVADNILFATGIKEGSYNSLFLGDVDVSYRTFREIDNIDSFASFYYIGEEENAIKVKKELVDIYGGKYPQKGYKSSNYKVNIVVIWMIVFTFVILLSIYQMMLERKNKLIQLFMGEPLKYLVLSRQFEDCCVYFLCFTLSFWGLKNKLNIQFGWSLSWKCLLVFLVINFCVNFLIIKIDFKKSVFETESKKILVCGYFYKFIVMVLYIFLISGCVELILEGFNYHKQYAFFEQYDSYSYCKIVCDDFDADMQLNMDLYSEKIMKGEVLSLNEIESINNNDQYLYADSGAVEYLVESIKELSGMDVRNKVIFLIPESKNNTSNRQNVIDTWESYCQNKYDMEYVVYKNDVEIICSYSPDFINIDTKYMSNPIILLNGIADCNYSNISIIRYSMYKMSEVEWLNHMKNQMIEENTSNTTNVLDNYLFNWAQIRRYLILGIVLTGLLTFLHVFINNTILEYEYRINAKQIVLQKILGYSLWERYKRIITISVLASIIGGVVSEIVFVGYGDRNCSEILLVCVFQLLVECVMIVKKTIRLEGAYIGKVLKGGIT